MTKLMAIANITTDSFFEQSRINNESELLNKIDDFTNQGADIIDIGGCSTRPNAEFATEDEELKRVDWGLKTITTKFPNLSLSIDTFRASVAELAVKKYNVKIVNDVSGGDWDKNMFKMVAKLNVPYVLTYCKDKEPNKSMIDSAITFFNTKIYELRELGYTNEIILDPGFGFKKSVEENFELLRDLKQLKIFNSEILVGISRKSMIFRTLHCTPQESLNGTTILNTFALERGATILRIHDIKEANEVRMLFNTLHR